MINSIRTLKKENLKLYLEIVQYLGMLRLTNRCALCNNTMGQQKGNPYHIQLCYKCRLKILNQFP